jgi:hypothetical protein
MALISYEGKKKELMFIEKIFLSDLLENETKIDYPYYRFPL